MIKMRNWLTGCIMLVTEERVEEYLEAGNILVSEETPKAEPVAEEKPKKVATRKTSKKK